MLYVDDVLIWGARRETTDRLTCQRPQRFEVVDLGKASYHLLGLAVSRDAETGSSRLSQEAFPRGLVERFEMAESRPITTPAEVGPTGTARKRAVVEGTQRLFSSGHGIPLVLEQTHETRLESRADDPDSEHVIAG